MYLTGKSYKTSNTTVATNLLDLSGLTKSDLNNRHLTYELIVKQIESAQVDLLRLKQSYIITF